MAVPSSDRSTPVDWSAVPPCPLANVELRRELKPRETPYWHALAMCRHIGVYKPNARICTWTARIMDTEGRYVQHRLASARDDDPNAVSYTEALQLAVSWFESELVQDIAQSTRPIGRADGLNFCPFGPVYTVGSALADYLEWSRIARSPGSHYNNIVLINYHLTGPVASEALEDFHARHLQAIAQRILADHASRARSLPSGIDPAADITRRAKRVYNNLITILRMAFQHAWDCGRISSDRPLRCLHRITVPPAARTLFLNREECRVLIGNCTPALTKLALAGLYTGEPQNSEKIVR